MGSHDRRGGSARIPQYSRGQPRRDGSGQDVPADAPNAAGTSEQAPEGRAPRFFRHLR